MTASLTILGVSVRAAAQAARRAGFLPHSIDLFADLDTREAGSTCKVARYPDGFLPALDESPPSAWMYTGGLENYPTLVGKLAERRPLLGNPAAVLLRVRDPVQLSGFLLAEGFRYPQVGLSEFADRRVFKPLRSGGGRGVQLITAGSGQLVPKDCYQQRFIEGRSISALFVAAPQHCRLLGATSQLTGKDFGLPEPFAYVGSLAPLTCSSDVLAELYRLGSKLADHFQLRGLFGVDLILRNEELWVLEVNPRLTASAEVAELAIGCNPVALHVAACEGGQSFDSLKRASPNKGGLPLMHGKCIVYARTHGVARESYSELIARWQQCAETLIADLPQEGARFSPGEPIATVFANGTSEAEVVGLLRERADQVLSAIDRE